MVLLLALHQTMFSIFDVYPQPILGLHLLRQHLDVQAFTPKYGGPCIARVCVCVHGLVADNKRTDGAIDRRYYVAMVAAIVMIVLFTVGVPAQAALTLRYNRAQLDREHIRQRYGFLYDGYKKQ